eukprot:6205590-Pleurochrysis_carterae.AAC.5
MSKSKCFLNSASVLDLVVLQPQTAHSYRSILSCWSMISRGDDTCFKLLTHLYQHKRAVPAKKFFHLSDYCCPSQPNSMPWRGVTLFVTAEVQYGMATMIAVHGHTQIHGNIDT